MKPFLYLIWLSIFCSAAKSLVACDQCGGSVTGSQPGLTEYSMSNFTGIRFHSFSYQSSSLYTTQMHTINLTGSFRINSKWQLSAYMPYKFVNYTTNEFDYRSNGIGDLSVINMITLHTNELDGLRGKTERLSLRAGLELPTGNFLKTFRADRIPAFLSEGSGSCDVLAGLNYFFKKEQLTLLANYMYKYHFVNSSHYTFGQQHALSMLVAEESVFNRFSITPYLGTSLEITGADKYYDVEQIGTSGNFLYAVAGFDCNVKMVNAGFGYDIPLYSQSESNYSAQDRLTLRLNYLF
jgi:hypothetical protein